MTNPSPSSTGPSSTGPSSTGPASTGPSSTGPARTGPRQNWIAVASAEHVGRGRQGGFMQVCHGKGGPLARIAPGDGVIYYSPTHTFGGTDKVQAFTALGQIADTPPYKFDMGGGFVPFRRDVIWAAARPAAIRPLLDKLDFTRGKTNWGYAFRFGILAITAADFALIAQAMAVNEMVFGCPAAPDVIRGLAP